MSYKVLKKFKDKKDGQIYEVGATYPSKGKVTKTRVAELTKEDGPNSHFDGPVIEEVKDETEEK